MLTVYNGCSLNPVINFWGARVCFNELFSFAVLPDVERPHVVVARAPGREPRPGAAGEGVPAPVIPPDKSRKNMSGFYWTILS